MDKTLRKMQGKQFSKDYQPPTKWTEERALQLANDLKEWMDKKDKFGEKSNMFFEEYLLENEYYKDLVGYLCKKFPSFLELIENIKALQKIRLIKFGVHDSLNASMTKFVLINNHGMTERTEQTVKKKFETIEELEAELKQLEDQEGQLNE